MNIIGFKMFCNKQLGKNITAFVLLAALLLPTAMQFASTFESHDHFVCTEQQTHFHQSIVECETCTFNYSPFHYSITFFKDTEVFLTPKTFKISFGSLVFHSFNITNTQLRAPPVLA